MAVADEAAPEPAEITFPLSEGTYTLPELNATVEGYLRIDLGDAPLPDWPTPKRRTFRGQPVRSNLSEPPPAIRTTSKVDALRGEVQAGTLVAMILPDGSRKPVKSVWVEVVEQ